MNETKSSFARHAGINVNEHIEKKGQFSYLNSPASSWRSTAARRVRRCGSA
jgi:hypothetical protein